MADFVTVDEHQMMRANLPRFHWDYHSLPKSDEIGNGNLIKTYFDDVNLLVNKPLSNMYLHSSDPKWSERVLSKVVYNFLMRNFSTYCVGASWIGRAIEDVSISAGDQIGGWDTLSKVRALAIYSIGDESDSDYGKNQNALEKILDKRFFAGFPTLLCSRFAPKVLAEKDIYSNVLLQRIFQQCVVVDVSNQLEKGRK